MIACHRVAVQWPFTIAEEAWELCKNNVDAYVVRCLALAVLRQHVAVVLALTLVALLTSLRLSQSTANKT